jgi:hypothetical protein
MGLNFYYSMAVYYQYHYSMAVYYQHHYSMAVYYQHHIKICITLRLLYLLNSSVSIFVMLAYLVTDDLQTLMICVTVISLLLHFDFSDWCWGVAKILCQYWWKLSL